MTTEREAIAATPDGPITITSLVTDLGALGLERGDVVIVHSSLSKLGWVAGGAQAVVEALVRAIGTEGTLVMPTHSTQLSDPSRWTQPPVPADWLPTLRAELPAYDAELTPTRAMGAIVDCFRHLPGVVRGPHPRLSFAAAGPLAPAIVADHDVAAGLGPASPLGRLYEHDAKVALLGVDHGNNTSLHLAEYRADFPGKRYHREVSPMMVDGRRQLVDNRELDIDDSDFALLGEAFARTGAETTSRVGAGVGRLCRQRAVVDFGVAWMERVRR